MPNTHREIHAYNSRIRRVVQSILLADVVGLGAATTGHLDYVGLLLPADAFLIGFDLNVKTLFTDGVSGTLKADIGTSGTSTLYLTSSANNLGAALGRTSGGTVGVAANSFQGGVQVRLSFTGSVNLSTFTAGAAEVAVLYTRVTQMEGELRGTG